MTECDNCEAEIVGEGVSQSGFKNRGEHFCNKQCQHEYNKAD